MEAGMCVVCRRPWVLFPNSCFPPNREEVEVEVEVTRLQLAVECAQGLPRLLLLLQESTPRLPLPMLLDVEERVERRVVAAARHHRQQQQQQQQQRHRH